MAEQERVTEAEQEVVVPERMTSGPVFSPQVDIVEKADSIVVLADMPGVSKDNVEVVLEKGVLSIDGHVEGTAESGLSLQRQEYEVGSFHRCFSVGEGLDAEKVEATMKDGVLRLVIPKSKRYKPQRIQIRGE